MCKMCNEMTDDIIHSTQYNLKYIHTAISANLQQGPLKLSMLIVLQSGNTPTAIDRADDRSTIGKYQNKTSKVHCSEQRL